MTSSTKRIPMYEAQKELLDLINRIENGEEPDTVMEPFKTAKLNLSEAVDRRFFAFEHLDADIEKAKENKKAWDLRAKVLENAKDRLKEYTKQIMLQDENLPYQGQFAKFTLQNSPKKLETELLLGSLTLSNLMSDHALGLGVVPDRLLKSSINIQLDIELLKSDLENGIKYPWAALTQSKHLRIKR